MQGKILCEKYFMVGKKQVICFMYQQKLLPEVHAKTPKDSYMYSKDC